MTRRHRSTRRGRRSWLVGAALLLGCHAAAALPGLPPAVQAALVRARLPPESLVAYVAELGPRSAFAARLAHRENQAVNPASLMKLYTTGVALELLGPAWTWNTPVLASGPVQDGVLYGDLVLQGRGDPTLSVERVWLMLRQLQQRGVREVRGDIVLDGTAFTLPPGSPADFDGEPLKPYNVRPDALLFNFKAITLGFVPDAANGVARVSADVSLAGVQVDASVPLVAQDCGDWRGALALDFSDPTRLRLNGRYPTGCADKSWPIAYSDARSYNARLLESLWLELGGRLSGRVVEGVTPAAARLLFELSSAPLAAVIRDINKYSNNLMAEQLFLTLGASQTSAARAAAASATAAMKALAARLPDDAASADGAASTASTASAAVTAVSALGAAAPLAGSPAEPTLAVAPPYAIDSVQLAREIVASQVRLRTGCSEAHLLIDNGSGLSRRSRSTARCLGDWLQALWASPVMPELLSSLPISGVDGTARRPERRWGAALGRAHLKTGSLRDVAAVAGYVLAVSGRRYAVVVIVNDADAGAARPVLDAVVQWAVQDAAR